MITPCKLKERYSKGENISALLRKEYGVDFNTPEIIEISYDMQTGSYIDALKSNEMKKFKGDYTDEIAKIVLSLCTPVSILEAGVGEATTLSGVMKNIGDNICSYGFDLSWSRVAFAKDWLKNQGVANSKLCCGDLLDIPFVDNSIDVVYTSHSIEPNGGNEEEILRELYRVARKYVILLEPAYELSSEEIKKRMDSHGYCKNLKSISDSLGYDVIRHELLGFSGNPLNPTAVTIISKQTNAERPTGLFACPKYKTPLKEINGALYSSEALVAYPILAGVPCLRVENGIFASKYPEVVLDN